MKLDSLEPEFRAIVESVIQDVQIATGLEWRATSCRRTIKEQNTLYAKGRTAPGAIVTRARGGQSPHNFGLAVDCCPMKKDKSDFWWNAPDGYWEAYGAIAESKGLTWGGNFHSLMDKPHIEQTNWRLTQAKWKSGDLEIP